MVIFHYLYILMPFAASFALGYFPVRLFGRRLTKGAAMGKADTLAPLTGAAGTAVGFLFAGMSGCDRFALAPDRVRDAWMNSGQAFAFDLAQPLFSGALCAVVGILLLRVSPRCAEGLGLEIPLAGFLISIADFLLWPVIFGPLVS